MSQPCDVKGKVVRKKDGSKRQTMPAHMTQFSDPHQAKGAVETHTKGGIRRKGERGQQDSIGMYKRQRETSETVSL